MGFFKQKAAGPIGFAVVDVETTGLYPSTDRIVEVAVVHLDANAEITGEFCTLINPGRDVGPTHYHGITAADVHNAPTFAAAAESVWQLLAGRVLVAHNVAFDARFLDAEFNRCGVEPAPSACDAHDEAGQPLSERTPGPQPPGLLCRRWYHLVPAP